MPAAALVMRGGEDGKYSITTRFNQIFFIYYIETGLKESAFTLWSKW